MDSRIFFIILFGSIVSLFGTMIGACMGIFVTNPSKRFLGTMVGFSGGLMLSIVVFELIPESLTNWSFKGTLIFAIIGIAIIYFIDNKIDFKAISHNSHLKVAFMAALGLMIHNLPEGIVMGCGFLAGGTLGIKMCIIISIHDIPEGIAVAAPMMASKINVKRILFYTFITAMPTAVGVWIGACIGNISKDILGACLSLASGIMLYVICGEMLPESTKLWEGVSSTMGTITGIILGLLMINVI